MDFSDTPADWQGHATREAAAIVAEAIPNTSLEGYSTIVTLVAIGWLQGVNYGAHTTLNSAELAFERLKADVEAAA
jgi:hypothetical protein